LHPISGLSDISGFGRRIAKLRPFGPGNPQNKDISA